MAAWRAFGIRKASTVCLLAGMALAASAQSFYNLDFESAQVTPPGPAQVPISLGLPGWTGYCGGDLETTVNYNQEYLDTVGISILDTNDTQLHLTGLLHGRYCALIQSGHVSPSTLPVDAALAQRGTIPAYAKSIVFNAGWALSGDELVVTFNGTPIPIAALSPQATYMVFGGDVTPFAGQTGELRFTRPVLWRSFPPNPIMYPSYGAILLDDIRFPGSPLPGAPVIRTPPQSQTAYVGSTVDFLVSADGAMPLAYQWLFNGTTPLSGATNSDLFLTNLQLSQSGAYTVVVTNAFGAVTSAPATLIVGPNPAVLGVAFVKLHDFCSADGSWPQGGLLLSGDTLYGTTAGGSSFLGTVFKIKTDGTGFLRLCSFSGPNGANLYGTLALSGDTLYGTTASGGGESCGTVFKVRRNGTGFATLVNFNGTNGATPIGGLALVGDTLYGMTQNGGAAGQGTLFRIRTSGSEFVTLHNFQGNDGAKPYSTLVSSGTSLYGTAVTGGEYTKGTVFKINTDGTGFTTLHHFNGSQGRLPYAGLQLSRGVLYGTTLFGGDYDLGTVFKVDTDGADFATLHSFSRSEGYCPYATPVLVGRTLYGTVAEGGGAIFAVNIDGVGFTNLHRFDALVANLNSDGAAPYAGFILSENMLYGTAVMGGSCGGGTLFALPLPILVAPQSQTTELGTTAGFCVSPADVRPNGCQWFFNRTNIISDATNCLLLLEDLQINQAGAYSVFVTNAFGMVTSSPAMLAVIPPVPRRMVPALTLMGQTGTALNLDYAASAGSPLIWTTFDRVALTNPAQWYFDLTAPLPAERFYRARDTNPANLPSALNLHLIPALTLTGAVSSSWRIDYINRFGPLDAWSNLATVVLTNTSQLYFDTSSIGQPQRLWRLVPVP